MKETIRQLIYLSPQSLRGCININVTDPEKRVALIKALDSLLNYRIPSGPQVGLYRVDTLMDRIDRPDIQLGLSRRAIEEWEYIKRNLEGDGSFGRFLIRQINKGILNWFSFHLMQTGQLPDFTAKEASQALIDILEITFAEY